MWNSSFSGCLTPAFFCKKGRLLVETLEDVQGGGEELLRRALVGEGLLEILALDFAILANALHLRTQLRHLVLQRLDRLEHADDPVHLGLLALVRGVEDVGLLQERGGLCRLGVELLEHHQRLGGGSLCALRVLDGVCSC